MTESSVQDCVQILLLDFFLQRRHPSSFRNLGLFPFQRFSFATVICMLQFFFAPLTCHSCVTSRASLSSPTFVQLLPDSSPQTSILPLSLRAKRRLSSQSSCNSRNVCTCCVVRRSSRLATPPSRLSESYSAPTTSLAKSAITVPNSLDAPPSAPTCTTDRPQAAEWASCQSTGGLTNNSSFSFVVL